MPGTPLIGMTTYGATASWGPWQDVEVSLLHAAYHQLVFEAGARPLLLPHSDASPLGPGVGASDVIGALDGLVIIGGLDVDPALYGEVSDRHTLCVSTQVGCAYGCKFCASGLDGWKRHLSAAEIVTQVLIAEKMSGERINNLVFMGMGEPMANYTNFLKAVTILNAPWGVGLGARKMTVSTSGLVPRIRELADQPLQIRLAISLHGASDAVRSQIMPVNQKHPVAELMDASAYYCERKKQLITFEYILIEGVNDAPSEARLLADRARGLRAKINLIPYNTVEGLPWNRPSEAVQDEFLSILRDRGIAATIRREKGHDIDAACGQLRRRVETFLKG